MRDRPPAPTESGTAVTSDIVQAEAQTTPPKHLHNGTMSLSFAKRDRPGSSRMRHSAGHQTRLLSRGAEWRNAVVNVPPYLADGRRQRVDPDKSHWLSSARSTKLLRSIDRAGVQASTTATSLALALALASRASKGGRSTAKLRQLEIHRAARQVLREPRASRPTLGPDQITMG